MQMKTLRPAINIGLLGGAIALLFGGWSIVVMSVIVGAMVGLTYGQRSANRSPAAIARESLAPGLAAGIITVIGGVIYTFIVRPLTGQSVNYNITLKLGGTSILMPGLLVLVISAIVGMALAAGTAWYIGRLQGQPERQRRNGLLGFLVVSLLIFPFFEQVANMQWLAAVITVLIYILLALGLNVVVGYAGLLDLGYAAFFAIGAYTTALLNSPQIDIQWNFWLVIWVAAAVAAVAGLVLGAPTLPLRGDYLAIVTLGFGEIVPVVFKNLTAVTLREPFSRICFIGCDPVVESIKACIYACTGQLDLTAGDRGVNPVGRPLIPFIDNPNDPQSWIFGANYLPWYFLVLALVVLSIFIIRRLRDSRIGRAWMAIREDELAASQMGIDPVKTKLLAFSIGATFSGFAGAFYGSYIAAIFPTVFDFSVSVIILCMVILGGLGNMTGVILGGVLIMGTDRLFLPQIADLLKRFMNATVLPNVANPALKDFLSTSIDPIQWRLGIFGLVLVIMMLVRPEGLVPSEERKAELHAGDEPAPAAAD
jgi:branched-chain amino acid transport system permease protein